VKLEEKGMIKPVITETNTNTGNVWHVKGGERGVGCRRVKRSESANEGEN